MNTTTKACIEFQRYAAGSYAEARLGIDGRDQYAPRVIHHQRTAAMYYRLAWERLEKLINRKPMNCLCTVCYGELFEGDTLADHKVFKCGELDYIELAHIDCAKRDNASQERSYWEYGP